MTERKRVAVLTTGRQDYGILRSTLLQLRDDPTFDTCLIVGGMHLSAKYGMTVKRIEEDGFQCQEKLSWLCEDESASVSREASRALEQLGEALQRRAPGFLLLVGDRYETVCAAVAATLHCVPVVHVHGGEETEGSFDNAFRHAITKMSHLHLVSHPVHASRVLQMGEDPQTVHVVGAPGLDNLYRTDLPNREELEKILGCSLQFPIVIVTVHPTTWANSAQDEVESVIGVMNKIDANYIVTLPNCDPGNALIRYRLNKFAAHPNVVLTPALDDRLYFGLLRIADIVLGNSSSAIIEAPSLGIVAVNIGDRQKGRLCGDNVISVPATVQDVERALAQALTQEFREAARRGKSPYGDGQAGERIVAILRKWRPFSPPRKRFFDREWLRCS